MRSAHLRFPAAAVVVATLGCQGPTDVAASSYGTPAYAGSGSPIVHRVTGGGRLDLSAFGDLRPETYGFTASVDAAGNVGGQVEIHFADPALTLHVAVTCLSVSGNDAWIGGVVTHTSNPVGRPEGMELFFRVQDNGEGAHAPADRMSGVFTFRQASRCLAHPPIATPDYEFVSSGVQVR